MIVLALARAIPSTQQSYDLTNLRWMNEQSHLWASNVSEIHKTIHQSFTAFSLLRRKYLFLLHRFVNAVSEFVSNARFRNRNGGLVKRSDNSVAIAYLCIWKWFAHAFKCFLQLVFVNFANSFVILRCWKQRRRKHLIRHCTWLLHSNLDTMMSIVNLLAHWPLT